MILTMVVVLAALGLLAAGTVETNTGWNGAMLVSSNNVRVWSQNGGLLTNLPAASVPATISGSALSNAPYVSVAGTVHATNSVASYASNGNGLIASNCPTSGNWMWTNTWGCNVMVMVSGGASTTDLGINGYTFRKINSGVTTVILQPNEWFGLTNLTATLTTNFFKKF